jgi:LmbE family N-acetylglucosaminyl deacetylase
MSRFEPAKVTLSHVQKGLKHPVVGAAAARTFIRQRAYPALCEGLAFLGRPLLLSRAEDMTSQTATRSCLVLAPHPDDETLGCGATISRKLASGSYVQVVIATDGRHSHHSMKLSANAMIEIREEEAREAVAILGLPRENVTFLRFEDGHLMDHRRLLYRRLAEILERMDPEEVFVSSIVDAHPDHRVLAALARELVRVRHRFPVLYEYPIWFWDPQMWHLSDLRGLHVRTVRMDEFRITKRAAIAAYRSQVTNLTGEAGWATLRRGFLRQFLKFEEIFFEV